MLCYDAANSETGQRFLRYRELQNLGDATSVLASSDITISKELYRKATSLLTSDLIVKVRLGYVGRSSHSTVTYLYDENNQEMARTINQIVTVDKTAHRPKEIPSWWREHFQSKQMKEGRLIISPFECKESSHQYKLIVPWSEMDGNNHTNYFSYVKFCKDAAMDAANTGAYTVITEPKLPYNLMSVRMLYRRECKANDVLTVHTWEDEDDPWTIYFDIYKDDVSIFQSTFAYHKPNLS